MLDVVPVVSHQDGVRALQGNNVAQFLGLTGNQPHVLAIGNPVPAAALGQGNGFGIGIGAEQVSILVQQADQLALIHRQPLGTQQNGGRHANRVHGHRGVDVAGHTLGQIINGLVQPGRAVFGVIGFVAPAFVNVVQYLVQMDRITEVDGNAAKRVGQFASGLGETENAFFLFLFPAQLAEVGAPFHDFLVADVHRYKNDGLAVIPQEASHGH